MLYFKYYKKIILQLTTKPLFQCSSLLHSLPPSLPNGIFFLFPSKKGSAPLFLLKVWQIFHDTYSLVRLIHAVLNQLTGRKELTLMTLRTDWIVFPKFNFWLTAD